jgi:serine/threonine-protein kinase
LLHRYSAGGDRGWLERARLLGERAVAAADPLHPRAHGLFKGEVGVALLAADLARPGDARFPLFEPEPA